MRSLPGLPSLKVLGHRYSLRLLSAREELEARAEGEALAADSRDAALCANACLLARALLKNGKPVFSDGEAVLNALPAGQIADLARRWSEFDREFNPGPWDGKAVEQTKKAWSTRLTSAFNGVCSRLLGRSRPRNESDA